MEQQAPEEEGEEGQGRLEWGVVLVVVDAFRWTADGDYDVLLNGAIYAPPERETASSSS